MPGVKRGISQAFTGEVVQVGPGEVEAYGVAVEVTGGREGRGRAGEGVEDGAPVRAAGFDATLHEGGGHGSEVCAVVGGRGDGPDGAGVSGLTDGSIGAIAGPVESRHGVREQAAFGLRSIGQAAI